MVFIFCIRTAQVVISISYPFNYLGSNEFFLFTQNIEVDLGKTILLLNNLPIDIWYPNIVIIISRLYYL